jgi:hypothetical protein
LIPTGRETWEGVKVVINAVLHPARAIIGKRQSKCEKFLFSSDSTTSYLPRGAAEADIGRGIANATSTAIGGTSKKTFSKTPGDPTTD